MTVQSPHRPFGYFLWGVAWLIIVGSIEALLAMVIFGAISGQLPSGGESLDVGASVITWIIGVPLCAWLFILFPFTMFSQAVLAFVASGLARRSEYHETQIVEFVGRKRFKLMEPRIDTPAIRVVSAVSQLGVRPGRLFGISAMVVTAGLGLVLAVPGPVAALAGAALVVAGAGGSVIGIRDRVDAELKKPAPTRGRGGELTEKYYKGLRYREGKRARDLQKARDAGRATNATDGPSPTAFDRWGIAEAEHAMYEQGMAAYNARKGVPGALDAAFELVFAAMDGTVTRAQAEQLVIDAAAYRGKKPVPVPAAGQ